MITMFLNLPLKILSDSLNPSMKICRLCNADISCSDVSRYCALKPGEETALSHSLLACA